MLENIFEFFFGGGCVLSSPMARPVSCCLFWLQRTRRPGRGGDQPSKVRTWHSMYGTQRPLTCGHFPPFPMMDLGWGTEKTFPCQWVCRDSATGDQTWTLIYRCGKFRTRKIGGGDDYDDNDDDDNNNNNNNNNSDGELKLVKKKANTVHAAKWFDYKPIYFSLL